jgi:hypothetical protein
VIGSGTLLRLSAGLGLSVALHWGALHVIGGAPAVPQGRGAPVADVLSARVVWAMAAPVNASVNEASGANADRSAPAAVRATDAADASDVPGRASLGPGAASNGGVRRTAATRPTPSGVPPPSTHGRAATPTVPVAASLASAAGDTSHARPFEIWELDRAPEFLYPPLGLDALPALATRQIDAVVSLFIDALGRLVGLEVQDEKGTPVPTELVDAIRDAFEPVSFLPGTLDGRAVLAVQRFEMRIDPKAPLQLGFRLAN